MNKSLLAVAWMALAIPSMAQAETIVVSNWADYMPPDLVERFTKETGIDVDLQFHATNEEIVGKIIAANGRGYDVVFLGNQFVLPMRKQGYLAELKHDKLPNMQGYYPEAFTLEFDPGLHYAAPYGIGTTGICYNSDKVDTPNSWYNLLRPSPDAAGKLTLLGDDRTLLAAALQALGLSINETDPDKLKLAQDLLFEAKKTMLAFDDTTFSSRLVAGEIVMAHAWDGWCNSATAENAAIKYVEPKEGTDTWVDSMVILASSEHKEAAHKFIDFVLKPQNLKWVVESVYYRVPNKSVMESLSPEFVKQFPVMSRDMKQVFANEQLIDLGDAQKRVSRIITEVKAAQ